MNHNINTRWLTNLNWGCSHFLDDFSELTWISHLLSKWGFLCSLNGHIGPPPHSNSHICWLWNLQWLSYFEHFCPISFKQMSLYQNVDQCPNKKCNQTRVVQLSWNNMFSLFFQRSVHKDIWAQSVQIPVFPSPTGYIWWLINFSLITWGIFYRFL